MAEHNKGLSTAQIAAKHGLTVASLRASYLPHMTIEEQTALFGTGFVPEPEPEPPVAVSDSPQEPDLEPEPDEPEEPKEWGVAVFDPDAKQDNEEGKGLTT
jgi:hypothetical protein